MKYEPFEVDRLRDVLQLAFAMQQESQFIAVPFDVEQTANSVMQLVINNPNGFGLLAYTDEGEPVGMITGSITPYVFSRGWVASDFAWYVKPEYRGSRAAIKLLKAFKAWATEKGALQLYMGVTTNVSAGRTGDVLQRMGFEHVGGNYRTQLNG
jgi:GNAT superfamily N-acetyltransferase